MLRFAMVERGGSSRASVRLPRNARSRSPSMQRRRTTPARSGSNLGTAGGVLAEQLLDPAPGLALDGHSGRSVVDDELGAERRARVLTAVGGHRARDLAGNREHHAGEGAIEVVD